MTVLLSFGGGLLTQAQQAPKRLGRALIRANNDTVHVEPIAGIMIEPTAPIVNLFERAQEGIERRDWKFAIDSLQRIIDDPQGSLLPREIGPDRSMTLYESASRRAVRRIASFPPQGLAAYRRLYDGQAKGMLARARDAYDVALLRRVAERFLLTRYGDDAVDLLASWLLDADRPGEVVSLLVDLLEFVPDFDVPEQLIIAKLAAARAELGQVALAKTITDDFRSRNNDAPAWFDRVGEASAFEVAAGDSAMVSSDQTGSGDWSWPMWGGSPTRQGLMPAISPTVTDAPPWSHKLPGRASYVWDRVHDTEAGDPLRLPTPGFAVVGDRLIVRQSGGCVALDMEDLSPIWTYPESSGVGIGGTASVGQGGSPDSSAAYKRYPSGSLTVAHGLALIIERSGVGKPPPGRRGSEPVSIQPRNRRATGEDGRIIAIDIETGEAVWERGRSGLIDDPLGRASIRSAPVAVGDELWAAYIDNRDLYVAVLDPVDGATLDTIALCAMPDNGPMPGLALDLALADGLVYVPTEYGVLFAIDAVAHTVRWAVRYGDGPKTMVALTPARRLNRQVQNRHTFGSRDASRTWLSSPPVVSGGLVLLSATDQDQLLAFSAAFGTPVWSASADGSSYVIGADERFIWLGGRSLSCLSLVDGSVVWTSLLEEAPSGRAVLSGDAIHVPTGAGLVTLDAATGTLTSQQLLDNADAPLGNVFCTDAALLSIEPSSVRKFPDTGGPYLAALEAYRQEPGAVTPALRLAWMQHLRHDSEAALQTLSTIDPQATRDDARRATAVARLQVEALLTLAASESGATALVRLAQAYDLSLTASDRLRTRLTRADVLVAMGRTAEAYEALLDTAFQPEAEQRVKMTDRVTASTRLQIASRLAAFAGSLSPADAERISETLRQRAVEAMADLASGRSWYEARGFLTVLTDLPVSVSLRVASLLSLADSDIERSQYEQGEQLLLQALALAEEAGQRADVLTRLVYLMLQPTQEAPERLDEALRDLESDYAEFAIEPDSVVASVGGDAKTVGAWVRVVRSKLEADEEAQGGAGSRIAAGALTRSSALRVARADSPSWMIRPPGRSNREGRSNPDIVAPFKLVEDLRAVLSRRGAARLVEVHHATHDGLSDRVVFHAEDDVVFCVRARDGALLWHTTLRLPESFTTPSGARTTQDVTGRRQVVADGQIAIFNGRFGMFAVGMRTGRRLWYKPFEFITNAAATNIRDRKMAARDGLLAAMPHAGRLTLMRMRDGSELWEHDLRGASVGRVILTERAVVAIDTKQRRAQFFERANGTLIGTADFSQLGEGKNVVRVVDMGHLLLGPSNAPAGAGEPEDPGVVAFDMHTGAESWRATFNKPIAQLFDAGLGYLGVALLGGDVMVLRSTTGEVAFTHRVSGVTSVLDGRVIDTNLVVQASTGRGKARASELIAIDIVTGAEDWRRSDLESLVDFSEVPGRLYVPALIDKGQKHARGAKRLGGVILDLRTGSNLGEIANLDANSSYVKRFNGDFGLYDGALLVGFSDGIQAYTTELVDPQGSAEGF